MNKSLDFKLGFLISDAPPLCANHNVWNYLWTLIQKCVDDKLAVALGKQIALIEVGSCIDFVNARFS